MQNNPLSIFHASVRPESLPRADLSFFSRVIFCYFGTYLGPLGPKKASIIVILKVGNYLNAGTSRGRADGFTVEALAQMRTVN